MEGKKISFGFMKVQKAVKNVDEEKKDYIECLEGKAIKVKGGDEIEEKPPIIIPMQPNTITTAADRLKKIAEEVESCMDLPEPGAIKTEPEDPEEETNGKETLDQLAVKELLKESKKEIKVETQELTLPVSDKPSLQGSKESTLEDYESIPIQEFGKAMLRGMGWQPGKEQAKAKELQVRPKGLGLGADKMIKKNQQKQPKAKEGVKELMIVKNAFVHVTTGKYSGCYGKVVSLDEDNGRVLVDLPLRKETVSLSEFMMHPVTKAEYDKQAKVINADKYEEYKRKEASRNQDTNGADRPYRDGNKDDSRKQRKDDNGDQRKDDRKEERKEYERRDRKEHTERKDRDRNKYEDNTKYERSKGRDSKRDEKNYDRIEERRDKVDSKRSKHRSSSSSCEDKLRSKKKESKRRYSSESSNDEDDGGRKRKSSDSCDSDSYERRKSKKSKKKHDEKRDIDKKRKGKKKKRDRDRSPYYKKCRK